MIIIKEEQVVHESFVESLVSSFASTLNQERGGSNIDYLKMKLGIEMLLINLSKAIFVYGIALIMHVFIPTLIIHLSYFAIRRSAFGLHANTSILCNIVSVLLFVGIPLIIEYITINNYVVAGLGVVCTTLLYRFAPADTDKYPILGEKKRSKLRKETVIASITVSCVALIVPIPIVKSLMMYGVLIQVSMVLPITYKLLKRSCNNYEQYEQ
ncbi:accessory gene regulator B family protein [Paenibacillus sp. N1-5-1-14]|uniref:accessory gene regulator B family protein n=1 Tax=Paenibacillus radicibacter TaxID=2972488 RepID=UPI0021590E87|nr:accessory gene regulator B family protein [Paenibacillus radicibacter]MCR8644650.1 accessory gene regulator B family protein [Paenibacillus radicibacter]